MTVKRKLIISIFILAILVCAAYNMSYRMSLTDYKEPAVPTKDTEPPAAKANAGDPDPVCQYYLKEEDGYVNVYMNDRETLYENTTIRLESLPYGLKAEIQEGKYLKDDRELYNFLENYSS